MGLSLPGGEPVKTPRNLDTETPPLDTEKLHARALLRLRVTKLGLEHDETGEDLRGIGPNGHQGIALSSGSSQYPYWTRINPVVTRDGDRR
jgi:hypothetical protein